MAAAAYTKVKLKNHTQKTTPHILQAPTVQDLIIWKKCGLLNSTFEQRLKEVVLPALFLAYKTSFGKTLYLSVPHLSIRVTQFVKCFELHKIQQAAEQLVVTN